MSINRQIMIFVSAILIVTIAMLHIVTDIIFNKFQQNSAQNFLSVASNTAVELIDNRLTNISNGSILMAGSEDLRQTLTVGDKQELSNYLDQLTSTYPYLSFGLFLNVKGEALATTPSLKQNSTELFTQYIKEIAKNGKVMAVNDVLPLDKLYEKDSEDLGRYSVRLANSNNKILTEGLVNLVICPIYNKAKDIVGYMVLGEIINRSSFYPSEYTDKVTDSYLSISIGTTRVCTNISLLAKSDFLGTTIPNLSNNLKIDQQFYYGSEYSPSFDGIYLFLYRPIFDYQHKLLGYIGVGIPELEYVKLQKSNQNIITAITIGSLPLILFLSWIIGRKITKPIIAGTEIAKKISRGDLNASHNYPLPEKPRSEPELLLISINEMAEKLIINKKRIDSDLEALQARNEEAISLSNQLMQLNEQLENRVDVRTKELQQTVEALRESDTAKSRFLANMSHELRTPLNSNIGAAELLLDEMFGPLTDKQVKYIKNIWLSSRNLLQLINDILDLSKIEAGKTTLNLSTFTIMSAFDESINGLKSLAYQKSITITAEVEPEDLLITADTIKLQQILYNLLSNAIKFSNQYGRIWLKAEKSTINDNVEAARFLVKDEGIGIKKEDQDRVFKEFEQVYNSYSREYGGTGLGLSITKKHVELHGGIIELYSCLNQGTEVVFYLPIIRDLMPEPNQVCKDVSEEK
jgi:signal transduction histidine kinase